MPTINPYQQNAVRNLAMPTSPTSGFKTANMLGVQQIAQKQTKNLTSAPTSDSIDNRAAGAALTQQSGQRALANAGQAVQSSARVGQSALATSESDIRNQAALRKLSLDSEQSKAAARLARFGEDVKNQILDSNLAFKRDEAGRVAFNERQLADWTKLKASRNEDLENFKQKATLYHERKMQLLEVAQKRITQELEAMTTRTLTTQDMRTKEILARAQNALKRKITDEAANRSQGAAIGQGIGMVVGGVVGAVYGGGVGAVPGAAAGGAVGGAIGGSLSA